jgi:hypothetical protein
LTSTSPLSLLNSSIGNERLGLEAGVDDDDVEVDADDFRGDELALPHFLPRERFSNSAAKFSTGAVAGHLGGSRHGLAFDLRLPLPGENPVSRTAAGWL